MALSHRRSEVLAALIGLVVLPPPLLSAQYRLCPPDTAIGGDPDDRTRLATLLGRTSGEIYLLRSWSSRMDCLPSHCGGNRRRPAANAGRTRMAGYWDLERDSPHSAFDIAPRSSPSVAETGPNR